MDEEKVVEVRPAYNDKWEIVRYYPSDRFNYQDDGAIQVLFLGVFSECVDYIRLMEKGLIKCT